MIRRSVLTKVSLLVAFGGMFGFYSSGTNLLPDLARSPDPVMLAALGMVVGAVVVSSLNRAIVPAMVFLGLAFVSPVLLPPVFDLGGLSLRYPDLLIGISLAIIVSRYATGRQIKISPVFGQLFLPLAVLLCVIGLSLVVVGDTQFGESAVSFLRLVISVLFAPIVYLAVRNRRDMNLLDGALIIFLLATVLSGVWRLTNTGVLATILETRLGGALSTNTFAMVSGLTVLYGVIRRKDLSRQSIWLVPLTVGLGLLGLLVAKSAGAIAATLITLALYWGTNRTISSSGTGILRSALLLIASLVLAAWLISIVRPQAWSGLQHIQEGSFARRMMIGYAGIQIFLDHPLMGVGWQASSSEEVLGSPTLNETLRARFPRLPAYYFFLDRTTGLHNLYIQILAELGLIGFAIFLYVFLRVGRSVFKLVKSIPEASPYRQVARFYAFGLVALLIWWNTHALYGGHAITILAVTFLAALAAISRLERAKENVQLRESGSPVVKDD